MILRRFSQALKEQNWTAIWIEFVLLVAGVFLGLQASNWNEERADARLAQDYLRRLHADLQDDQNAVRAEIAYYSQVREAVQRTDALLAAPDADPRALVVNAYRATEIVYVVTAHATWDQMVSSGHLGLLPGSVIDSGLPKYYTQNTAWHNYEMLLQSAYRQHVREAIPLPVQMAIRAGCSDVRDQFGFVSGFSETCKIDIDPAQMAAAATALRTDSAIRAALRYQYSLVENMVLDLYGLRSGTGTALKALSDAGGASGTASP